MNINEVQNSNTENANNNKNLAVKNYAAQKADSNDFSYYVEVSKAQEVKDQLNQEEQKEQNNQEEQLKLLSEKQEETSLAYVQSFQNMNSELFDMGIKDAKSKEFSLKDDFRYNINLSDLTLNDIKLFEGLTQKSDISINSFDTQNQTFNAVVNGENLNLSYKSIEVSKTLFTALENAAKTGKSVRLDFGNDTSVILRVGKDGKLSADFVPNEKAMENVLRNALPQLKAKFEEENIPYGELNYRNYNQQKDNQKGNNKEKKDE